MHQFKFLNAIPVSILKHNLKSGMFGPDGNVVDLLHKLEFMEEAIHHFLETRWPFIVVLSG